MDAEDGDCVAAGVDGEQQVVGAVERQCALGGERVDDGPGQNATNAAARVMDNLEYFMVTLLRKVFW